MAEREWTQEEIDHDLGLDEPPMMCPVSQMYCPDPGGRFCEDYGCVRKARADARGRCSSFKSTPLGHAADKRAAKDLFE